MSQYVSMITYHLDAWWFCPVQIVENQCLKFQCEALQTSKCFGVSGYCRCSSESPSKYRGLERRKRRKVLQTNQRLRKWSKKMQKVEPWTMSSDVNFDPSENLASQKKTHLSAHFFLRSSSILCRPPTEWWRMTAKSCTLCRTSPSSVITLWELREFLSAKRWNLCYVTAQEHVAEASTTQSTTSQANKSRSTTMK